MQETRCWFIKKERRTIQYLTQKRTGEESVATHRAKRTDRKSPTWDAQFDRRDREDKQTLMRIVCYLKPHSHQKPYRTVGEPRSDQILIKVPRIDGLREMDRLGRQRETDERVWSGRIVE